MVLILVPLTTSHFQIGYMQNIASINFSTSGFGFRCPILKCSQARVLCPTRTLTLEVDDGEKKKEKKALRKMVGWVGW